MIDGVMHLWSLPEEHGRAWADAFSPTVLIVVFAVIVALALAAYLAWKLWIDTSLELQEIYADAPLGFEWEEFNTHSKEVIAQGFCSFPIRPPSGPSGKPGHEFRSWPVESHSRLWASIT